MVRQRAHALTLLALFWTIFSLGAILGELDSWNHGNHGLGGLSVSAVIVLIHATIIYFAIRLWRTETPTATNGEGFIVDDLLDKKPAKINILNERSRFLRVLMWDTIIFLFAIFNLWRTDKNGIFGWCVFFGSVLFLHVLIEGIRYLILQRRFNKGY
jgi:hypothetical protein